MEADDVVRDTEQDQDGRQGVVVRVDVQKVGMVMVRFMVTGPDGKPATATEILDQRRLEVTIPQGGLPPDKLAEKRHLQAMRTAKARTMSYVDALASFGYVSEMEVITQGDSRVWRQVLWKDNEAVYATTFVQDNRPGAPGVCMQRDTRGSPMGCPAFQRATPEVQERLTMWRCGWRWSDIESCPEGPQSAQAKQDVLDAAEADAHDARQQLAIEDREARQGALLDEEMRSLVLMDELNDQLDTRLQAEREQRRAKEFITEHTERLVSQGVPEEAARIRAGMAWEWASRG